MSKLHQDAKMDLSVTCEHAIESPERTMTRRAFSRVLHSATRTHTRVC